MTSYPEDTEVINTIKPYLLKDDDFVKLFALENNTDSHKELQSMCKEILPKLGSFKPFPLINTLGEEINFFHQIIARKLFRFATDRNAHVEWNIPKPALLRFACELGLFEALDYQAAALVDQIEKNINSLPIEEIGAENYNDIQTKIDTLREKLQKICEEFFPLHWKAGFVFAAIYQLLEVHALILKLDRLQDVDASNLSENTLEQIKKEAEETFALIQTIRGKALKNLLCANLLMQAEVLSRFPFADNLSNKELLNKFIANPLLTQYATASTDAINLIANQLRFNMGHDADNTVDEAKLEVQRIMQTNENL